MGLDVITFKKWALSRIVVMLVLSMLSLALAPFTGHYRGFYLAITLGGIITVTCVVYIPLIYVKKAESVKDVAVRAIQCLWVATSMGIGYMVTALAPYFQMTPATGIALFVIGLIMSIIGTIIMLTISKRTGVPLAVYNAPSLERF
ncbi:MAG: hypothetical protein QXK88_06800 [Desulfurococcaceae archaeon]